MILVIFSMINMSRLYHHPGYPAALTAFNASTVPRRWLEFRKVQLDVANNRCPICECRLDNSVTRKNKKGEEVILTATVDHFRPKDATLYPFLAYAHNNYLLMCSDCNNAYKGNQFPLYPRDSTQNTRTQNGTATRATGPESLHTEQPLIVNPITDDLLALFSVVFRYTPSGKKVLELKAKDDQGYLHEKAKETIKVFSLGDCEVNVHKNPQVQNGRIALLNDHFKKFHDFILALKAGNKARAFKEYQKYDLGSYGFTKFITQQQFVDLI